jgi:dTDP-4-amino-4,6-dideoxygalactose transaminase
MKLPLLQLLSMHEEIEQELDEAWKQVSRSSKFIGGEFVQRFEEQWAGYCGTAHCVGVSSGTAALQLALAALGIGVGDEVIVPTNTFFGTVDAVFAVGATPVFVDVDPTTLLLTAPAIKTAITHRTAAVIPVHLYGQPVDMDSIKRVTSAAGLAVIEDAAQAHGATWRGRKAGSLADIGCFSFYPGKNLGAFGDAGAVVTDDPVLAERIRSLGNYGRSRGERYRHEEIGGNHRLDALQAAILLAKLKRLDDWNACRRRVAAWYRKHLSGLPVQMVQEADGACSNYHLAVIQCGERNYLRQCLEAEGIETLIHYPIPCHKQPALKAATSEKLPVAECAAQRIISLPMGPHVTEADTVRVAHEIRRAFEAPGRYSEEMVPGRKFAT